MSLGRRIFRTQFERRTLAEKTEIDGELTPVSARSDKNWQFHGNSGDQLVETRAKFGYQIPVDRRGHKCPRTLCFHRSIIHFPQECSYILPSRGSQIRFCLYSFPLNTPLPETNPLSRSLQVTSTMAHPLNVSRNPPGERVTPPFLPDHTPDPPRSPSSRKPINQCE